VVAVIAGAAKSDEHFEDFGDLGGFGFEKCFAKSSGVAGALAAWRADSTACTRSGSDFGHADLRFAILDLRGLSADSVRLRMRLAETPALPAW
jgi:hypothetical protein